MKKVCNVCLIGRPNVGKSTFLNNVLNFNLSIITDKPQTTKDNIRGIYNDKDYQIIFIDTPGIHKAENLLSERLNSKSYEAIENSDVVLFLTPANEAIGTGDKFIIEKINETNNENKIAVISKIDLLNAKEEADKKAEELKKLGFEKVFGIGQNLPTSYLDLINEIKTYCYEDEPLYPDDQIGDITLRFMAKEIIRETAINNLKFELPHSIAVEIEQFDDKNEDEDYKIYALIYVKKKSQKPILIGKDGQMIKKISIDSRHKMEKIFNHKVFLNIKVKISEDWVDNEFKIKQLGY